MFSSLSHNPSRSPIPPHNNGGCPLLNYSPFRTVIEALGLNAERRARDRASFYTIRHTVATDIGWKVVVNSCQVYP